MPKPSKRSVRRTRSVQPTRHRGHWRRLASGAMRLDESQALAWHSVLFGINIVLPALAGVLLGDLRASIVGALAGLMLSFSDTSGNLFHRYGYLLRALAMVLGFGFLGATFKGYNFPFWSSFCALTFLTGFLSMRGNPVAGPFRLGAMALVSMAGLTQVTAATAWLVIAAAAVNFFTRTVGWVFFPNAPAVKIAGGVQDQESMEHGLEFCLLYAGSVALGLFLAQTCGVGRPIWVCTTILLVMQPDAVASYQRILQRVVGTAVGVLAAVLIIGLLHSVAGLLIAVTVIALVVPYGSPRNYWVHSALVACLVLVLYDLAGAGHHFDFHLVIERLRDVGLGCLLALLATGAWVQINRRGAKLAASQNI